MSEYSWVATEVLTGKIIADLPDLQVEKVKLSLGRYESAPATLPLPNAPENWERATLEGATNLILLADNPDDPAHGIPVWGAMVTKTDRDHTDILPMTVATVESYLDRRFVGDKVFEHVGQNDIFKYLIETHVATGSNGGLPIRVQVVNGGAGKLRDKEYKDQDDKTVYSAITDMAAIIDGFEWTIGWEWQSNPERITPVAYVGDRIGNAVTGDMKPAATFYLPGSVSSLSNPRDYSNGNGANDVMATSSGQGDIRPQSPRQTFADPQRPTFEHRFSPSTSITEIGTLTEYAEAALEVLKDGITSVGLSAATQKAPKLGVDWNIGDDIGFDITETPGFPNDHVGVARAIGWELELGGVEFVTPILAGEEV